MNRFQGHFSTIKNMNPGHKTLIHDHFNQPDHRGVEDFTIYVLDFIHMASNTAETKKLRLKVEQYWIHRLKSFSRRPQFGYMITSSVSYIIKESTEFQV